MALFLFISIAIVIFTGLTPDEWRQIFKDITE